nr:prolyl oligopeptidase family serine peptidase [Plastoroseomonas hellenica]
MSRDHCKGSLVTIDPRPTLDAPDDDPWLWLEEVNADRALVWAAEQTARTAAQFADAVYVADRDGLRDALDRPDRIPFVTRRGGLLYNHWQDAANPRGLWRRTTLAAYQSEDPDWELMLDLDALAAEEGEDWVWKGATSLPPAHDRAILSLSRGGGDAVVMREFDITTRSFIEDGFSLPEAKSSTAWIDRDTLLLSSALGEGMATTSGYPRTIRLWRRGADPLAAPVIFETSAEAMGAWGGIDREDGQLLFLDKPAFFETLVWFGDTAGPRTLLEVPRDARAAWHRGWLVVVPRTPWTIGEVTYAPDTVLGIRRDAYLAGARAMEVLFIPAARRALSGFFWCAGRLVLSILDDLRPVFTVWTPGEAGWTSADLPGLPAIGVVHVWPLDQEPTESDGTLLVNTQDPVTPATMMLARPGLATPTPIRRAPALFRADGLVVTRHEAISVDGERIPYVQTGPAEPTGDAPVHLTGYGGFQISSLPYYSASVGRLWLAKGGTSVDANIRGGGEFGTAWHEAGRGRHKSRSHDDFAAVAADLVKRGVTKPGRIAAEGGSNGGLLIANMLTRYPEHFGALFCTIPLIDMRRYSRLLAGSSWIAEYGDPDKPEEWNFVRHISAYHNAAPGQPYPSILIATTRKDDRVHPGHARKFAAKLRAMGYDNAWYHEPAAGGHGYGKDNAEVASFAALGAAFLRKSIGWQ